MCSVVNSMKVNESLCHAWIFSQPHLKMRVSLWGSNDTGRLLMQGHHYPLPIAQSFIPLSLKQCTATSETFSCKWISLKRYWDYWDPYHEPNKWGTLFRFCLLSFDLFYSNILSSYFSAWLDFCVMVLNPGTLGRVGKAATAGQSHSRGLR